MARKNLSMAMEFDQLTLKRLQSVVRTDLGFWGEVRTLLKESADHLESNLQKNVPIGKTRVLSSSIKQSIDQGRTPLWAKVTADAERTSANGKSFRYGWALQSSKARFIYHYLSGRRSGAKTLGWFSRSRRGLAKKQKQLLERMATRMQRRWAA